MKNWIQIDPTTGEIRQGGSAPSVESLAHIENVLFDSPIGFVTTHYIDIATGNPVEIPAKPGPHYLWDWSTHTWVVNGTAVVFGLLTAIKAEFTTRTYASITYESAPFDADETARGRIIPMVARLKGGGALPPSWTGWRDANNSFHWAESLAATVGDKLDGLKTAIEDREQGILSAAWDHQAAIEALVVAEDMAGLLAYDATSGWP